MGIEQSLERYHRAGAEFSRRHPGSVKDLVSGGDDVTLATPLGPPIGGWSAVSEAPDFAASRFRDGAVTAFEPVATYATTDLVTVLEIEHWTVKVGGREEAASFELRVTSTFRRKAHERKLVDRHTDPIATPDAEGLGGAN